MSESWTVHLVYTDDRSHKFWRARTDGSTLYLNYGRVGTSGQTSVKKLGSEAEARAALAKQADGKRRKGYVDVDGETMAPAEASPEVEAPPEGPRTVALRLQRGGRDIDVRLSVDGAVVRTEVAESFDSPEAAGAAFARIEQAMVAEGYQRK